MGANSVFCYVNVKATFCLVLFATLNNFVFSQNLYTSILDDARNALMGFSSSTTPTTAPATRSPSGWGVSGWSGRRRRRSSSSRRKAIKVTSHASRFPSTGASKRKSPSNKFLVALDQIERSIYAAQASSGSRNRHSSQRLAKIKANIKLATQQRNYLFARQALGLGLYSAVQLAKTSGRKKRSTTSTGSAVKAYMNSIKKDLGAASFDTFMSVNGDVTLMFAIDTTGSMWDEIHAAQSIAKSIVNHTRNQSAAVDYILSPFNDPGTGPVTYEGKGNGTNFEKAIDSLSASGGGDCPELTFKGILDAMRVSPNYGSPMYVFTDASAKDYSVDNMDEVLSFANRDFGNGITINFFTTGLCGKSSYKPFEELAKETCGYMFNLPKSNDLKKLSGITAGALVGATCLESGGSNSASGKKRRSVRGSTYSITVDDSTEKIFITVVRQGSSQKVALKDPKGTDVIFGVTNFPTLVIYEINNPRFGTWKLAVSGSGKHSYQVKGVSKTNVDFEYFFIMIPSRGRGKPIPISHPLLGHDPARVVITVAGNAKINRNTLKLDLISEDGRRLTTATVTPRGTSGAHFSASFRCPAVPFTLKLRGKTKKGYNFQRRSHNIVHPSNTLIRVIYARNDYTIPAGRSSLVTFLMHNNGPTDTFDIKAKDRMKYFQNLRGSSITVRQSRTSFFSVVLKAPLSASPGKGDELLVTAKGRKSKKTVSLLVRLMVAT
ncbi:hemicentin-2-like [Montipora foliosa]|uniref:hemicentin-2-like n=1 Tax=Montipora foliosa TaxID=591990 RepID=UPI0035F20325